MKLSEKVVIPRRNAKSEMFFEFYVENCTVVIGVVLPRFESIRKQESCTYMQDWCEKSRI